MMYDVDYILQYASFLLVSGTNIIPTIAPYYLEHEEVMHLSPPPEIINSHMQDMAAHLYCGSLYEAKYLSD